MDEPTDQSEAPEPDAVNSDAPKLEALSTPEETAQPVGKSKASYWLTRFVFLRLLAFIYFLGFLSFYIQMEPLIGSNGLLPAASYLERLSTHYESEQKTPELERPTLFWYNSSDSFIKRSAAVGVALALLVMLGCTNSILMAALWGLYLSIYHIGQIFYGFGWEMLLLEAGFLAIFLCPTLQVSPFAHKQAPSVTIMFLYRWVLFRVMFGAGLIKIRGDECWRDFTCMVYHYETQPIPNAISWYLHQLPELAHKASVLGTHVVELVVPFMLFGPKHVRRIGGIVMIVFQVTLIVSGNLSWLNWLTIAVSIPCLDDRLLRYFIPKCLTDRLIPDTPPQPARWLYWGRVVILSALTGYILYLSIEPTRNLFSPKQRMNASFHPLHIVNTYGAFGSVGKVRPEVILMGTYDRSITRNTKWQEYDFKYKPGTLDRRPGFVSPFHYRLDWHIWFAAMSNYKRHPWLVHLIYKLLQGDPGAQSLLGEHPFAENPPTFIKAELYEYEFTDFDDRNGAWWKRRYLRPYLPPLSLENDSMNRFLRQYGWLPAPQRPDPP